MITLSQLLGKNVSGLIKVQILPFGKCIQADSGGLKTKALGARTAVLVLLLSSRSIQVVSRQTP